MTNQPQDPVQEPPGRPLTPNQKPDHPAPQEDPPEKTPTAPKIDPSPNEPPRIDPSPNEPPRIDPDPPHNPGEPMPTIGDPLPGDATPSAPVIG